MSSIHGTKAYELPWIFEKLGFKVPSPFHGITYEVDDQIQAVAFFYHWTGNDVELALYARNISKTFLRALFLFATETLKVSRITLKTRADRTDTLKLYKRLGAEFEGTQKHFYDDGEDALLYRLDTSNYRFR
jgi:RimJ/RimL family protein N-acetyltransferase